MSAPVGNPYGHFDDARCEYVITRPDTPLPWLNYLGTEDFFGLVTNTGGGYAFYRDAKMRRLTRYRYNDVPLDNNGRYLYIDDNGTVWNPGWKPTRTPLDHYTARHGLGYTVLEGEKNGLRVTVRYFIPLGETLEVWDVRVQNIGTETKNVKLYGFVEWCLWDALDDMTNFQRNFSTGQVEVDGAAIFHKTEYRERRNHFAYFAANAPVDGFDTARQAFVGVHEGFDRPRAIVNGGCTGSIAYGWSPVAALQRNLSLAPGEEQRFAFLLGYAENPEDQKWAAPHVINKTPYRETAARFADAARIDAAFDRLAAYWADLLAAYHVDIDDPHVRRMVNVWNPYQCMTTLNFSRSASMFESGIGRGMGYRDSNQDLLGVVHLQPERARQRLIDLASTQLSDGTCFHQYQPLTKKGNAEIGGGFNDDPLWLALSTAAYVHETGDRSVLDARAPYADAPDADATLLDHLVLSLDYTLRNRGPHGLPLIGHADWNDCLNLNCFSTTPGESFQLAGDIGGSVAESVMIAGLYCAACEAMRGLFASGGDTARAGEYAARAEDMRRAVDAHGWDGDWFLRAYDAAGRKIGSKECEEGKIFIESQGWGVLGGIGLGDGRAARALDAVRTHLSGENGIVLQQPAYQTYHKELGEISSYPPGYKENAGIFTHNNTWIQCAEAMIGRGDEAFAYYMAICPSDKERQIETYRCEPYVYSQMTAGPDAPTPGEGKNAFLTGTAAWSLVAITQYMLGIRPGPEGLAVNPCIPKGWKGYTVQRRWRGRMFEITIKNPNGLNRGVKRLTINGQPVDGAVISPDWTTQPGDTPIRVEALLES